MATRGRDWTEGEIAQAIALYLRTSFGRLHSRNPDIMELAVRLDRTPGSVAMKMANLASIDETLDRKGLSHATQRDRQAWKNFFELISRQASALPPVETPVSLNLTAAELDQAEYTANSKYGSNILSVRSVRQGQALFRDMVLTSYDRTCAITGIRNEDLLIAGHIRSWAVDAENRMNPRNGICLNRLHDRAFEIGLIGIGDDNRILYSKRISESDKAKLEALNDDGIFTPPKRFAPDPEFLRV